MPGAMDYFCDFMKKFGESVIVEVLSLKSLTYTRLIELSFIS